MRALPLQTVALSRHSAPSFLGITEAEAVKLRHVPAWMRWLFCELVGLSDFRTGQGRSSWAQLVSLLDFDKPAAGRRAAEDIGPQRVRRAFEQLADLGLVARDKGRNEQTGWLFFQVAPRTGLGASTGKTDRVSDRAQKRRSTREATPANQAIPTGIPTGGSGSNSTPYPRSGKLSTPLPSERTKPPAALLAEVRARRGEKAGPRGGQNVAPAGHAPRGLQPPESARADSSPAGNHQQTDKGSGPKPLAFSLPKLPAEVD